jgi:trehalose utilization protein
MRKDNFMAAKIRVTVWNEFRHEKKNAKVIAHYPNGMHAVIAAHLNQQEGIVAKTATLDEPEHGLTDEVLAATDVLTWWGHLAHHEVSDKTVDKVQARVLEGMGLIVLHSGHHSKIFRRMMGTSCNLRWREADERELIWFVNPGHPILQGVQSPIILPKTEMYGEMFDIPQPNELLTISTYPGGEVFRSGCSFTRGAGKIFYFSPGHETYPIYHDPNIQRIIANAVRWAMPTGSMKLECPMSPTGWFEKK